MEPLALTAVLATIVAWCVLAGRLQHADADEHAVGAQRLLGIHRERPMTATQRCGHHPHVSPGALRW